MPERIGSGENLPTS